MFTGIIEATAIVDKIEKNASNINFTLSCPFTHELKIDQSLAHNGTCLTVIDINNHQYTVTAILETLEKTNLGLWKVGTKVNIERSMKINDRLDGHIVQGHIDTTGRVISIENKNGSFWITIGYHSDDFLTVPQGSITVNGISLTVADSQNKQFSVAIIPYTWYNTNMCNLEIDDIVNLEFDIIGKYVTKLLQKNAIK